MLENRSFKHDDMVLCSKVVTTGALPTHLQFLNTEGGQSPVLKAGWSKQQCRGDADVKLKNLLASCQFLLSKVSALAPKYGDADLLVLQREKHTEVWTRRDFGPKEWAMHVNWHLCCRLSFTFMLHVFMFTSCFDQQGALLCA